MTEEQKPNTDEVQMPKDPANATTDAWQAVGEQFKVLGSSIAEAFKAAWESETNRKQVEEVEAGIKTMAGAVEKAIREAAESPEVQKLRGEAERAVQSAKSAGEKTIEEMRPQLVASLERLNAELQQLITRLETAKPEAPEAPAQPESPAEPPAE